MTQTKQTTGFTAGPWKVDSEMVIDSRGIQVCVVETVNYDEIGEVITDAECDANARLIAEAPAMVEALRWLANDVLAHFPALKEPQETCVGLAATYQNARAVLARVEGRNSTQGCSGKILNREEANHGSQHYSGVRRRHSGR